MGEEERKEMRKVGGVEKGDGEGGRGREKESQESA